MSGKQHAIELPTAEHVRAGDGAGGLGGSHNSKEMDRGVTAVPVPALVHLQVLHAAQDVFAPPPRLRAGLLPPQHRAPYSPARCASSPLAQLS